MSFPVIFSCLTATSTPVFEVFNAPLSTSPVSPTSQWSQTVDGTFQPFSGAYNSAGVAFFLSTDLFSLNPATGSQSVVISAPAFGLGSNSGGCLAIDSAGNFYGPDLTNTSIIYYTSGGAGPTTLATVTTGQIETLAINYAGNLIVVASDSIGVRSLIQVTLPSGVVTTLHSPIFTGVSGYTFSSGIAFDAQGNIYVSYIALANVAGGIAKYSKTGAIINESFWTVPQPTDWQATHVYTVGTIIDPAISVNGVWQCTTGGTSAGTRPSWPLPTPGATVTETTGVAWICLGIFIGQFGPNGLAYDPVSKLLVTGGNIGNTPLGVVTAITLAGATANQYAGLTGAPLNYTWQSQLAFIGPLAPAIPSGASWQPGPFII
jgi:hypothetical protein